MQKNEFKYIYGPVPSWRLGASLGIDPISHSLKQCVFDCIYCQVGRAVPCSMRRKIFVPTYSIVSEISRLPKTLKIDYLTFSGRGEPTLARNLGELIEEVKKIRKEPVAVITNSSLLGKKDVREELLKADLVMAKLDASTQALLKVVNNPVKSIIFAELISNLKHLRRVYKKILALQIMFVKENFNHARSIARIAAEIKADKIFINTPLRPSECMPLSINQMGKIKKEFLRQGLETISVFDKAKKKTSPINIVATLRRRGASK
ncbi:MAG: radical SAM protein [Candidatus Omnitrophica bacterium]|nr:radical SAM protein [Candidatus Omnitrophota bacterium]